MFPVEHYSKRSLLQKVDYYMLSGLIFGSFFVELVVRPLYVDV